MSDENIYFYDAWLMHEGFLPYRDFFFAHPPMHLLPGWITFGVLGGFDLTTMKLLPDVAAFASSVFIYLIVRKASGRVAALLAAALFLFSHDLLRASSHWTAISWAIMWMSAGFYLALEKKPFASGIMLGLGVSTGIYIVPGALLIAGMTALNGRKDFLRYLAAFVLTLLLANGYFLVMAGEAFLRDVLFFHLMKKPMHGNGFISASVPLLFHNFFLLSAPLYLLPLLLRRIRDTGHPARHLPTLSDTGAFLPAAAWSMLLFAGYVLFLMMLSRIFHYYYLLLFPFAAVCAGLFIGELFGMAKTASKDPAAGAWLASTAAALLLGAYIYPKFETMLPYYKTKAGQTVRYNLPRSPLPEALQKPVTALFSNKERRVGDRYMGITYYLWHESRIFDTAAAIAGALKEHAHTDETIFGDSTTTPLVALLSGVRIADNFVDTNTMRFSSGETDSVKAVEALDRAMARRGQRLTWALVNPKRGIARNRVFLRFFQKEFRPFRVFKTRYFGTYILLKAKAGKR